MSNPLNGIINRYVPFSQILEIKWTVCVCVKMYNTTIGRSGDYYGILLHALDRPVPLFLTIPTGNIYDSHGMSYKIECWYRLFTSDFTNSACLYENPNAYDRFTLDAERGIHYTVFVNQSLHEVMDDIRAQYLVGVL